MGHGRSFSLWGLRESPIFGLIFWYTYIIFGLIFWYTEDMRKIYNWEKTKAVRYFTLSQHDLMKFFLKVMKRKYFSNNTQKLDLISLLFSSFKMNTSFVISWCTLMVSLTWNKWSNRHWEKRTSSAHWILKSEVLFVNNLFTSF